MLLKHGLAWSKFEQLGDGAFGVCLCHYAYLCLFLNVWFTMIADQYYQQPPWPSIGSSFIYDEDFPTLCLTLLPNWGLIVQHART